nr:hypothetical protein [Bacillota bacterium]
MKKIKKAICLLMSVLMIPIANLSVNAEQIYSGNLTEYLYNGEPFSWNGFGPSGTVTEITPSFTNSDSEVVAIPPSSYNPNHSRAAKVSFTAAGTDVCTKGWNTPNLTPLVDNGYLRVELYFDGTAEQAKNMSFYLRDTSDRASREVSFNVFTPKEWSECLIPIADLIDNDFTGGNLREFRMKTSANFTGSCDVYIHEIGFKSLLSGYKITNPVYTDSKWGYYDTTGTYVNINGQYSVWSNSVNADVGSFSAERNAGQGSSVKYDMLALKNTYTGTNTANIQLPI